jgi:hypothetical protein
VIARAGFAPPNQAHMGGGAAPIPVDVSVPRYSLRAMAGHELVLQH